ncbi:class I adenylate-forming enzyme family protein [Halocatena halophila]|uniref:class I adenylate-forming enzyme family protein n=1 Tax=Halocatena halophila TaxID=2814576 RepID=UPI002ED0DF5F
MEYYEGERLSHMGDLPKMAADRYGSKTAFVGMAETQSYSEFAAATSRMAAVLANDNVGVGDRVGLYIPNTLQFPSTYFGVIESGAIPVPLNLRMDTETLAYIVDDASIDCLIGSPLLADDITELAEKTAVSRTLVPGMNDPDLGIKNCSHLLADTPATFDRPHREFDDVACQPYTSGTTGRPKGVLLTHENLLTSLEAYDAGGNPIDPDKTGLLVLPLFHIYALNALLGSYLYNGASSVLLAEPDPEAILAAIDRHEITQIAGVPALYTMTHRVYCESPSDYDLSSLELALCAAAPLADSTKNAIETQWDVRLAEGWGMTETAPAGATEPARGVRKAAGCVGPPVEGLEVSLVDPETRTTRLDATAIEPPINHSDVDTPVTGEIAVRGPQVFEGYHNRPDQTAAVFDEAGWFYTGDLARVDADGYLWIVDRKDDMIIVGGENVYPSTVEEALYDHPGVAEAAVVGADHDVKGRAPVAYVVPERETTLEELDLRRFTIERVPSYAHPRRIFFVEELPRSATQKVRRFELEADLESRLDGPLRSSNRQL